MSVKIRKKRNSPPPRGSSPPPSLRPFTIPKTGSKELFVAISNDSHEGKDIIKNINNSLFDAKLISLDVLKIERVQNSVFETEYAAKRKELKEKKCSVAETSDSYGFLFFRNIAECKKACSDGIKRGRQRLPSRAGFFIGDKTYGIYLCRCADMLNITPLWDTPTDTIMLICKFMKGNIKSVGEQKNSELEPTPDFDAHTSKHFQRGRKWPHDRLYNTSQIYLYEIDLDKYSDEDDSAIYAVRPRQCLPYAIATFKARQNLQPTIISKTPVYKPPSKPQTVPLGESTVLQNEEENTNLLDTDFNAVTQHRIRYLWGGFYFMNQTSVAQIQIGVYAKVKDIPKLPIEGSHLCITQKISISKLERIFPPKIFRKCPCLSMKAIENVETKRFLHAEIRPASVTSDKIEKLHAHWLKSKMAGVCTLGAGLKLFIIPTGEFTEKLGITGPGYPPVLHCIFLRPFLEYDLKVGDHSDANVFIDEPKEKYEEIKRIVFLSLRDRLQHNEELKKCNQSALPSPLSQNEFGYTTAQRLKVINVYNNIRKAYGSSRKRSVANNTASIRNTTPTKTTQPPPAAHFPDQRNLPSTSSGLADPRLSSPPQTQISTPAPIVPPITPMAPPPALPSILSSIFPISGETAAISSSANHLSSALSLTNQMSSASSLTNHVSSASSLTNQVSSGTLTLDTAPPPRQRSFTDLLNSPAMQLYKQTEPDMFEQILSTQKNRSEQNIESETPPILNSVVTEPIVDAQLPASIDTADVEITKETNVHDDQQKLSASSIVTPLKETIENETVSTDRDTQDNFAPPQKPSERTAQHSIYCKSTAGAFSCLFNLSEETLQKEREHQQMAQDHRNASSTDQDDRLRRRDRSRDKGRGRSRDREDRSRDRNSSRREKDGRSRGREDRPRDRDGRSRDKEDRSRDREGRSRDRDEKSRRDDRSRRYDRSRERDDRSRDKDRPTVSSPYKPKNKDVENDVDYGVIWSNKMAEMEKTYLSRVSQEDEQCISPSKPIYVSSQSSQEETQSEGHLVIDTDLPPSSSAISDDQTTSDQLPNQPVSDLPRVNAEKVLQGIGEAYYNEGDTTPTPHYNATVSSNDPLHDLREEMRLVSSQKAQNKNFEFQELSSESELNNIEETIITQRTLRKSEESAYIPPPIDDTDRQTSKARGFFEDTVFEDPDDNLRSRQRSREDQPRSHRRSLSPHREYRSRSPHRNYRDSDREKGRMRERSNSPLFTPNEQREGPKDLKGIGQDRTKTKSSLKKNHSVGSKSIETPNTTPNTTSTNTTSTNTTSTNIISTNTTSTNNSKTWKSGVKRRTEQRKSRISSDGSSSADEAEITTKKKKNEKQNDTIPPKIQTTAKPTKEQPSTQPAAPQTAATVKLVKLNMAETLQALKLPVEQQERRMLSEDTDALQFMEHFVEEIKQSNKEVVDVRRTPLPSREPSLPKQKKKSPSNTTPSKTTVTKDLGGKRTPPPPIEMDISPISPVKVVSPPIVSYRLASAGFFPQIVQSNLGMGLFQYATKTNPVPAIQQPSIAQSVSKVKNRGITSVLGLSSSRQTPRSLKEWEAKLPHSELDDFCLSLIKDVKNSLE